MEPVRFGVFEVDLSSGELRKQGLRIRLQEQPFAVLSALLERPGEVVTREELIRRLWPDGTVVDFERGLNAAVTRLRQALSDSAETPRYVETVARRGYRFIGAVEASRPERQAEVRPPRPVRRWAAGAALAVLAAAAAGFGLLGVRRGASGPLAKPLPLTTEPGFEAHVSFSPEGSQVTFHWGGRVYVKPVGQGEPVRLTAGTAAEYGPAWSPDGRLIAFLRDLDAEMFGVYVIPAHGGTERKLTESPAPPYAAIRNRLRQLDWTPDSRNLIVSAPDRHGGSERLFLISVEGGEKRWLTKASGDPSIGDREPAVSFDGRTLAFVRGILTSSEEIHLMRLRPDFTPEGDPRPLTPGRSPAWTADGSGIVFRVLRVYTPGLARISVANGKVQELRELGDDAFLPAVSRTGRLAYSRAVVDVNIWRQEIDGVRALSPAVPLIASTARDGEARYSPDETRIAFQTNRSGSPDVWTCTSGGADCRPLTTFQGAYITGTPRWSPDGKSIAFDSAAEGRFHVYSIPSSGGPSRRLTSNPAGGAIPSWSRDGKWIYYYSAITGRPEIWKIPSGGGAPVQITRRGGLVAFEAVDGTALYYTKTEDDATLWRSALDGSNEESMVEGVALRGFALAKDGVYYLRQGPEGHMVRYRRFADGQDTLVARAERPLHLGLDLSPSGRYLLYSQFDQLGADLMLVEGFR